MICPLNFRGIRIAAFMYIASFPMEKLYFPADEALRNAIQYFHSFPLHPIDCSSENPPTVKGIKNTSHI